MLRRGVGGIRDRSRDRWRERRPYLLAVDHPLVAVEIGAGLDVGQVGARVGLRVALTPDVGTAQNARQEPALLRLVPEMHDRRAEQSFADDADASRSTCPRVFLVEDHLVQQRCTPTAVLRGPPQSNPAVVSELLLPNEAILEERVLVAGPAAPAHAR